LSHKKKITILAILGFLCILYGSFITLDWTQHFFNMDNPAAPELPYSRATKVLFCFMCAVLAWMIGKDGLNRVDTRKVVIIFSLIIAGDICLVIFPTPYVGIALFIAAQVFLILRNGQGFRQYNKSGDRKRRVLWDAVTGAIIAVILVLYVSLVLIPLLQGSYLLYFIIVYGLLVCVSLWTAWAAVRIGYFPPLNAWLIAIGITFFFTDDLFVGLNMSLPTTTIARSLVTYVVWIFYSPALALLALSGYRWGKTGDS